VDDPPTTTLKCEPHFAAHLRAQHTAIAPGYHTNKRHWNTLTLDGSLRRDLVEELLGHSYTLVVDGLPRRTRDSLRAQAALARGRELLEAAWRRTGDYGAAEAPLAAARRLAEDCGDRATLAGALDRLGFLLHFQNLERRRPDGTTDGDPGRVADELALFERALALRRELGDDAATAESLFHVGLVHQLFTGRWDEAEDRFQEAHALAEDSGDVMLRSEIHRHLGAVRWHAGDFEAAIRELERSLELRRSDGLEDMVPSALIGLGHAHLAAGHRAEAIDNLRRGVELAERLGHRDHFIAPARRALAEAEEVSP
jgi:tetratricopeptide (TPR) repeat protein